MDLAPVGAVSQLQNSTYTLGTVFLTTFLTTLGMEGLRAIVGESLSRVVRNEQYCQDKIHSSPLEIPSSVL